MAPIRFPINDWDGNGRTDDLFDISMEMEIDKRLQKEETDFLDELIPNVEISNYNILCEDDITENTLQEQEIRLELECESDYDWRMDFKDCDTYGVSPYEYDTQAEFIEAYNKAEELHFQKIMQEHEKKMNEYKKKQKEFLDECREKEAKRRIEIEEEINRKREEDLKDKNEYIYCGVKFDESSQIFHYITDDESVNVGDNVMVPVGYDNKETTAVVMSIEKCLRTNAPYPFYKTKKIIKKI